MGGPTTTTLASEFSRESELANQAEVGIGTQAGHVLTAACSLPSTFDPVAPLPVL